MKKFDKDTRSLFSGLHDKHVEIGSTFERVKGLIDCESMGVADDFFKDKVCADLGCGSALAGTVNLLDLGAQHVTGMDLDESIFDNRGKVLDSQEAYKDRYNLQTGSLEKLPFEDNAFDFVLCQGVIHHVEQDELAFDEIARVVKPGGHAMIMVYGKGGLITDIIMDVLRNNYFNNDEFRTFYDHKFSLEWLQDQITFLKDNVSTNSEQTMDKATLMLTLLGELIDEDFILMIRDRIEAPKYKTYDVKYLKERLDGLGFDIKTRIARHPKYDNIRSIFSYMYKHYDGELAKLLYGNGHPTLFLEKRAK